MGVEARMHLSDQKVDAVVSSSLALESEKCLT